MRGRRTEGGFTLIEVVVVVAVIAILAAILTPYITKYIEDSKIAKAKNETQVIGAAIANAYKDLGRWPNATNAQTAPNTNYGGLFTGATAPAATFFGTATGWAPPGAANWNAIDTHLVNNGHNYLNAGDFRWRGPYATALPLDPWGNPYVVNALNFPPPVGTTNIVWVLSAGPNRVVNTNIAAATTTPGGDDVAFRIQ